MMIIRIFGEGQYELPEPALARLHELDDETETAVSAGTRTASIPHRASARVPAGVPLRCSRPGSRASLHF
jgi:hypothetical protein